MSEAQSRVVAESEEARRGLGTLGRYQLLERIGAGGLGEVIRARDTLHGRTVAIKRVPAVLGSDPARLEQLRRTVERISAVSHPGLTEVYELGEEDGEHFLAVEFVPGGTLAQLLAGRPLHPRRAAEIALEIAEALGALHAAGLVHGDVRPENVLVTPKGHAKLIDSDLASFTAGGALRASAGARMGALAGAPAATLRYMAPEQVLGEGVDARGDLFSLGIVLHEMLTGVSVFDRPQAYEILLAIVQAPVPLPSATNPALPASLDRIVERAAAKSLAGRYQTASELVSDLRAALSSLAASADEAAATAPVEPERRRSRVLLVLGAALAGALGVLGWLAWH